LVRVNQAKICRASLDALFENPGYRLTKPESASGNPAGKVLVVVPILSTVLTLVYTFLTGIRVFFGPINPWLSVEKIKYPPLCMSQPLLALALVTFLMGLYPMPFLFLIHSVIGNPLR
jgi:formate hydrogenlyase subunit 3/multisubunit Na+/H+ antiporter MnhD subunit